ncbi:MAG: glycosyltransferase family 4 protein [Thiohalocapsa sp.]|nr:glycosyltransferase family 4 protein [Thiohalocapsa sp.]
MSTDTVIFTICARNYLGFAKTLAASLHAQQPDCRLVVWLLDEGPLPDMPDYLQARYVPHIVEPADWVELSLTFNIRELATSVKPMCFLRHFEEGAGRVLYVDPDIFVFRPLDAVFAELDAGAGGVLTPHILSPLPRDDAMPDDLELLGAGVFNLGFLAVAACDESDRLLRWWARWLRTHCFEDKQTGTFTDQKWINFAPAFCPGWHILRDTGYNVAYWNLPQRKLARSSGQWSVDGRPLIFFHFSGFDPTTPTVLSKHQSRITVAPGSALSALLRFYAERLLSCGYAEALALEYPKLRFDNGAAVDDICRALFRDASRQGRSFRTPLAAGKHGLFDWCNEPIVRAPGNKAYLTRYLARVNAVRPDVVATYPDLLGEHWDAYVHWLHHSGITEMALEPAFLPALAPTAEASAELDSPLGVRYVGYLSAHLGLGEAARGNIRALRKLGIPTELTDVSHMTRSDCASWESEDQEPAGLQSVGERINIVHVNADQFAYVRAQLGAPFFDNVYTIGMWAWETSEFPEEWHGLFALVDEIWVGGSYMAEGIAAASPVPVLRMPHVVEVPDVAPSRREFGLDEAEFIFLFMFDFHSTPARKNPEGAILAFSRAFSPDQPVRLVIKSMNGSSRPEAFARLRALAGDSRVTFIDKALDSRRRFQLIASADAFVSLHRAEGFGLGIAEAMALGKPVIATGWSGNMDFMNVANSLPVSYKHAVLAEADPPYPAGTVWAEPDLADAARLMRRLWSEPDLAAELGERARSDMAEGYSAERIGALINARLQRIRRGGFAATRDPGVAEAVVMAALTQTSDTGPVSPLRFMLRKLRVVLLAMMPARYRPAYHRLAHSVARKMGYC